MKNSQCTTGLPRSIFQLPAKTKALDFGFGNGDITVSLIDAGYHVTGFEIHNTPPPIFEDLAKAQRQRLTLVFGAKELLLGKRFDLIVCREVLEHVPDDMEILLFFHQLLTPQGMLIVSVPTEFSEKLFSFFDRSWLEKSEHVRVFSKKELEHKASDAGYFIEEEIPHGGKWFLLWFLLSPLKTKHKMGNPTAMTLPVKWALRLVNTISKYRIITNILDKIAPKSCTYILKKKRPLITCIYDFEDWILGTWAKEIKNLHGDRYDIEIISMFSIANDKTVSQILEASDAVFLLLPHANSFLRGLKPKLLISAVHHWVIYDSMYNDVIAQSDILVTGSAEWKGKILEKRPDAHCLVINSGAKDVFKSQQDQIFTADKPFRLSFFGKMGSNEEDRKGTRHLRSLVNLIIQSQLSSKYELTLAGDGWQDLVTEIATAGLKVNYYPNSSDEQLCNIYNATDVYLMLSDVEGGPATVAEAMACGCIVLASCIGLAKDVIIEGVTGFFVKNSDTGHILDLLESLRANPSLCEAVSKNSRSYAEHNLRFAKTFAALDEIFADIPMSATDASRQQLKKMIKKFKPIKIAP